MLTKYKWGYRIMNGVNERYCAMHILKIEIVYLYNFSFLGCVFICW